LVSLVIALKVMTPAVAPGAAGLDSDNVAAAVPGELALPVKRNFSLPAVERVDVTKSATVVRNTVG
jgi:hypothetical protein